MTASTATPAGSVASPNVDQVPASRSLAAATRRASSPRIQLLSPPGSPMAQAIRPDDRFGPGGRVRPLLAYDAGLPPPAMPNDAPGVALQHRDVTDTIAAVIDRLDQGGQSGWAQTVIHARCALLLGWLADFAGGTWEQRWLACGADTAPQGWATAAFPDRTRRWQRHDINGGLYNLIQARVLRPSYGWLLTCSRAGTALDRFLQINAADDLTQLRNLEPYRHALSRHQRDAEHCIARVMIRTGKPLRDLQGEELLHYADVVRTSGRTRREHLAWELLVALGVFTNETPTLRAAWSAKSNSRQHSVATLVDRYGIPPSGVRDLLVDYLGELKPGMDYASLTGLAYRLVRLFWWEILQINPQQADLRLDPQTITTWRERLALTSDGSTRRDIHSILFAIRSLYRDLAEWAHTDPARWGIWVAPCPVPRAQSRAAAKDKQRQKSRTQARTRVLTPLLPALVAAAAARQQWGRRLIDTARAAPEGTPFAIDGVHYRRSHTRSRYDYQRQSQIWADVLHTEPGARPVSLERGRANLSKLEEDAFWAWALVETLRHSGVRIEELLELTQLSLRHYTPPSTNTLVPLLHIVPSKTDAERLIPMSPELVTVLLAVQRRAKNGGDQVPLSVRYDPHEKTHGDPLPHLFARRLGARHELLSPGYARTLLGGTAEWAGLHDAAGPVRFTPHDFRRLFTTELVGAGLPLHIAASLLGHLSLDTTRGYTAVFPEHVIAAHEAVIERRRALRPDAELRSASGDEWAEFEQHFLLRKVALGSCHRPYGTACVHEHACTRCRFLRVDPAQLGRLEEMTTNAEARLVEAKEKVWLGEVAALEESLGHLRRRHSEATAQQDRQTREFS
jgi:integrase